jgi:hypothetical protein
VVPELPGVPLALLVPVEKLMIHHPLLSLLESPSRGQKLRAVFPAIRSFYNHAGGRIVGAINPLPRAVAIQGVK